MSTEPFNFEEFIRTIRDTDILHEGKITYGVSRTEDEYELEIYRRNVNGHPRSYLGPDPDHVLVMTLDQAIKRYGWDLIKEVEEHVAVPNPKRLETPA